MQRAPRLSDRYEVPDGRVFLTGVQALVRVAVDTQRSERAAGSTSAALITGYQGSPLGGLDLELLRHRELLTGEGIHHVPAVNEELAATAVMGSQLRDRFGSALR